MTPEDLVGALLRGAVGGREALVEREIQSPRPRAEIGAGVGDSNTREQPYVLAFAEEA